MSGRFCVDCSCIARVFWRLCGGLSVRSCVRPVYAAFDVAAGLDEFRKRGSNRLNDLIGPLTFPECPGSWLTNSASSLQASRSSCRPNLSDWLPTFLFLGQHRPYNPRRLVRHGSCCEPEGFVRYDLRGPDVDLLRAPFGHECPRRHAENQQLSYVLVTLFRDFAEPFLTTARFV